MGKWNDFCLSTPDANARSRDPSSRSVDPLRPASGKAVAPRLESLGNLAEAPQRQGGVPMLREPQLDNSAPWKQRFRAPVIASTQIARLAPTRGLVVSNRSGVYQLYAWDVPSGELRQLTSRPEGVSSGVISQEGRYVYYLND